MTRTLNGAIVGLSGFIGRHHLSAARSVISPRLNVDACVPGTVTDFESKRADAMKMGFESERIYPTVEALISGEQMRSRILDFAIVASPNHVHAEHCIALAETGIHVICDKPLARTRQEADTIAAVIKATGVESCVTATYCGHRTMIEARQLNREPFARMNASNLVGGKFTYVQNWLQTPIRNMKMHEGKKQAHWRKNPATSGEGGATGDILSHLLFQLHFITGLKIVKVRARRRFVVEGAEAGMTDDEVIAEVELENGAVISMQAAQYAGGHQNDNSFELWYKDGATLDWDIRESEYLGFTDLGARQLRTRSDFSSLILADTNSMPALHVDGWHNADARLMTSFAWKFLNEQNKVMKMPLEYPESYFHPDVLTGRNIAAVTDAVIESSKNPYSEVLVDWKD